MSPTDLSLWRDRKQLRHVAVLAAVYFIAAFVSVQYTRFEGGVAMVWIAAGLLCADLRHRPQHSWWLRCLSCLGAGATVTVFFGLGPAAALPIATVNVCEAALCAHLLNRAMPQRGHLASPREISLLILVAGVIVPVTTAFPAAGIAKLSVGAPYWHNWLAWVSGHAVGTLTIMPLAKLFLGGDIGGWARSASRKEWAGATGLVGVLTAVTLVVFGQTQLPLLFLPFLPMTLIVFRLGRLGAALSLVVIAVIGIGYTLGGTGPINMIHAGIGVRAQFLQFYLATALLMSLPVAAELKRRKQLYTRLEESSALYQVLADRTGDILMVLEVDGLIRFVSPAIRKLLGLEPGDFIGRRAQDILVQEDVDAAAAIYRNAVRQPDETFMQEFRLRRSTGQIGWFEAHLRATIGDAGNVTGVVSVVREVSARKERELDLSRAATSDPLTTLLNRRGLESEFAAVNSASSDADPICVALFDLDHFKLVNDKYGHAVGDEVLRAFSKVLSATVRDSDVVARLGGEEFAVLLVGADMQQAYTVCDRIRYRLSQTVIFTREGATVSVTVSAGLAMLSPGALLEDALRDADAALYQAKASGRDRLAVAA